jgi:HlyD family secretion protein
MPDLSQANTSGPSLARTLRWPVVAGTAVIATLFIGVLGWAAVAPLASAAIAPGVVSPEGSRRIVQHLEGGIIRELLVRDGSRVQAGDLLIRLEDVQTRARHDLLATRRHALAAERARLRAELSRSGHIDYPQWLLEATKGNAAIMAILSAHTAAFAARRQALADRQAVLRQQIEQLREAVGSEQGSGRVQPSERQARHRIAAAALEIEALASARLEEAGRALADAEVELVEVELRLSASRDVLRRTEIRAPIDGTVVAMRVNTPGGVIQPGAPIMEIVPHEVELLVDVRIAPTDIDVVRPGLPAQVVLPAYSQRTLPRIEGEVVGVSADALTDPGTGEGYFEARIRIDPRRLARLGENARLLPGMPAEVFILTGERTALQYLLQPFVDSIRRSAREI